MFGTRVALYPLSFVVSVLVARALGPADRGIYAFLGLVSSFLLPLLTLGFGASIIYLISNGRYQVKQVALTCAVVGALQGLGCAVLTGGLWKLGWLGETAQQTSAWCILPYLMLLPLQGASLMSNRILVGTSWFRASNVIALLSPLLTAALMLVLVILFRLGLRGAVVAAVATGLITGGYSLTAVWRRYEPEWRWNRAFVQEGLRYGFRAWLGDLAIRANLRFDQFLLGITTAPDALGTYAVAVSLSELLWILPDSLAVVTFNKLAAEKSEPGRIRLVGVIHRALWLVVASAALAMGALGLWLVPVVYGATFGPASWYLLLLLPGTLAMTTAKVITKYFGAIGLPGRSSLIQVTGALVSIAGYLILIPRYGPAAAAACSTSGYAVTGLTAWILYRNAIRPATARLTDFSLTDLRWLHAQARVLLPRSSQILPTSE